MNIQLHTNSDDIDIADFVKKINPEIIVMKSGNILDLIKDYEIFIILNMSTTILEAQISNKPTISLFVTERGFGISKIFESNSCISVIDSDFEKIFSRLLNDESFKNNLIHNGTQFSQKYLSNQQSSSKHLLSFLESF